MDNTPPKISFIPKGSLVREESFLARPRPRSLIGILAIFIFVLSIAAYGGLYFFGNFLESKISEKRVVVQKAQQVFSGSLQVEKANSFRFRAETIKQLLDAHIAVSPIFKFISDYTLTSIMYSQFSFTKDGGKVTVKLAAEAPSYAAVAYQKEVLSKRTDELSSFAVSDVTLTQFGTVTFGLSLIFNPRYLSYANNVNNYPSQAASVPAIGQPAPGVTTAAPAPVLTILPTVQNARPGVVPPLPPVQILPKPTVPAVVTTPGVFAPGASGPATSLPPGQVASGATSSVSVAPTSVVPPVAVAPVVAPSVSPVVIPTDTAKPSFLSWLWSKLKFW